MLKKTVLLLCIASFLICAKTIPADKNLQEFDEIVAKGMKEFHVPAVAVAVIQNGHVVLSKGYGLRDVEKKLPATADTLFLLGSGTKAFTTFLVGTCVDEGLLSWDQPVIDLFPNFRMYDPYATYNVTMRDLLTHRWGLPRHDWCWYNSPISREELVDKIRYLEPTCRLRERFNYNNISYTLAGTILEKLTGKSWEDLMQERILKPLGMNRTHFSIEKMKSDANFAYPYRNVKNELKKMPFRNFDVVAPAGGVITSVNDMIPWLQVQLDKGIFHNQSLLSSSTLQEIHTPQIMAGAPGVKDVIIDSYGLGWSIQSYRGFLNVNHDGGPDGFTTIVSLFPHQNIGMVILCNRNLCPLPHLLSYALCDALLALPKTDWLKVGIEDLQTVTEVQPEAQEQKLHKQGTSPSHPYSDYEGEFVHPGYGTIKISYAAGALQALFNGITYILDHWHYDVFVIGSESEDKIVSSKGTHFTFRTNLNGEVEELFVPFEPSVSDICFKKKPPELADLLKQFTGTYQIYHYTVDIEIRNNILCAIIPGQPIYELIPCGGNEFSVKSMTGNKVRFNMKEALVAQEVQLIQPYGKFTAKRIR